MLVDLLFSLSFIVITVAIVASNKRGSMAALNKIPGALISSIVLRWLGGLWSHSVLLTDTPGPSKLGLLVRLTTYIASSQSVTVLVFIYLSFVAFNFFITSKGISRASEVLARFYLDSVPGRQIAIDADLAAGLTDYAAAKESRIEINERSTLYSMLDSISKFMVAENTCSILVLILFGAGFSMTHWSQRGVADWNLAAVFGSGLLWQASQLLSACAYSYVLLNISSGSKRDENAYLRSFQVKMAVFAVTLLLAFFADSIWPVLLNITALIPPRLYVRFLPSRARPKLEFARERPANVRLTLTPLTVEVDPLLAAQLSPSSANITAQIDRLRRIKSDEYGFQFPQVTIMDNIAMEPGRYRICLNNILLAEGQLMLGKVLAVPNGRMTRLQQELSAVDPVYGLPCLWINKKDKATALAEGCVLTDEVGVLLTHVFKVVSDSPQKLLLQAETQRLLSAFGNQELVTQLRNTDFQNHGLHKVFVELLEGGFSLSNLHDILIAVYDAGRIPLTSTEDIVGHVRRALSAEHIGKYRDLRGQVPAIGVSSQTTRELEEIFVNADSEGLYLSSRDKLRDIFDKIYNMVNTAASKSQRPILISKRTVRPHLAEGLRRRNISVFVASYEEVVTLTDVNIIGII